MRKVAIQGNASGTGTFTIAAPNSNTDRTLTLPDEVGTVLTSARDITAQAMNGPVFSAIRSGGSGNNISVSSATWTKITFNATDFDTDSVVNTSTGVITPSVAGYYQINCSMYMNYGSSAVIRMGIRLYKNGVSFKGDHTTGSGAFYGTYTMPAIVYCNGTTDYLEMYVWQQSSTDAEVPADGSYTYMSGALVRAG